MSSFISPSGLTYLWTKIKTWVNGQGFLTQHQDISGKADLSEVLTSIGRSGDYLTQTKGGTASNVTYILERRGTYSYSIDTAGWYRVGRFSAKGSGGTSCIMMLNKTFANNGNAAYVFSITLSYTSGLSITQLAGDYYSTSLIDKIRVEYLNNNNDFYPAIDIHISTTTSAANTYYVTFIGGAHALSEYEKDPTLTGSTFEFDTTIGMKAATPSTHSTHVSASNSNGAVGVCAATNRGLIDVTNNTWIVGTDGTNTWLSQGNVGIGTTTPAYKLDVNGDVSATNFRGALIGNADTATKLAESKTIWGQSFDGSSYVRGTLSMFPDTLGMNNDTAKLWFRANTSTSGDGYSPYIQGIFHATTGRKRLSVFQINNANYTGTHNEVFTILPDGKVGVGTIAPSSLLHVNGVVTCTSVTQTSDESKKEKIDDISISAEDIAAAPNITFKWKEGEDKDIHGGTIAQYWDRLTPYYVHGDECKTLEYSNLAMSCSIELAREVVALKEENAQLKKELAEIKEMINKLIK